MLYELEFKFKKNTKKTCIKAGLSPPLTGVPARIYMWTAQRLEFEGADVQLFCRGGGNPAPSVMWYDQEGRSIGENDDQYAVCVDVDVLLLIVCSTSYFMFSIAVLPHSPGEVYHHLLLRWETRTPGVAPFSFRIGIFLCIGDRNPIPNSLWEVVDHSRRKMHETCLIISHDPGMRPGPGIELGTFGSADKCSTTELS